MRRIAIPRGAVARLLALTGVVLAASAHVGSPDIWLEGKAGPYPVVVNVQVPGVVPGIAHVYVRVTGDGVQQVAASANKYDAMAGSPPPDVAEPVSGDAGLYQVPLWIMTPGSNSVTVFVRGTRGTGTLLIPAVVVAHQRLTFSRPMAVGLGSIGVLLFLGMVSIFGALTRESFLPPGATPDRGRRRRARLTMAGAAIGLSVVLLGGWRWWNAEDQYFARTLYQPMRAHAAVRTIGSTRSLDFVITDSAWLMRHDREWFVQRAPSLISRRNASALAPLVPDHGKLMHLVLVREPDLHMFAHLHPTTVDSVTFSVPLPMLPAGHYRIFADVVRESGDAETMITSVDLPALDSAAEEIAGRATTSSVVPDSDDSWHAGPAAADSMTLADGSVMRWEHGATPLVVGRPAPLTFTVTDSAGRSVTLQPYMGMASHAIVLRDDGTVFMHLHPTGTVAMAAQEALVLRRRTDTVAGMVAQRMQRDPGMAMVMSMQVTGNTVHFPYAFPKPGHYHMWVQVKRGGRVLTGAFQADVRA